MVSVVAQPSRVKLRLEELDEGACPRCGATLVEKHRGPLPWRFRLMIAATAVAGGGIALAMGVATAGAGAAKKKRRRGGKGGSVPSSGRLRSVGRIPRPRGPRPARPRGRAWGSAETATPRCGCAHWPGCSGPRAHADRPLRPWPAVRGRSYRRGCANWWCSSTHARLPGASPFEWHKEPGAALGFAVLLLFR